MQKVKDFSILIRTDKKFQLIAVTCLLTFVWTVFQVPGSEKSVVTKASTLSSVASSVDEVSNDLIYTIGNEVNSLRSDVSQIRGTVDEQVKSQEVFQERVSDVLRVMLERTANLNIGEAPEDVGGQPVPPDDELLELEGDISEPFGDLEVDMVPKLPSATRMATVSPGDSVRVRLLTGAAVPTDGTPYPVLFEVIGSVTGPNGSQLDIGGARIVAAAQGSLSTRRVLYRLTSMTVGLTNGRREVLIADGWIVGEDGLWGMEGQLNDPLGKSIGAAGLSGALGGVGEAISRGESVVTSGVGGIVVDNRADDVVIAGIGGGLNGASKEWGALVKDRVKELIPSVEVLSDREVTAVFSKPIYLKELYSSQTATQIEEGI